MLSCTTFIWNIKQLKFREAKGFWVSPMPCPYPLHQVAALLLTGSRKQHSLWCLPSHSLLESSSSQVLLSPGSTELPGGLVSGLLPLVTVKALSTHLSQNCLSLSCSCSRACSRHILTVGSKTGKKFNQGVYGWNRVLQRSRLNLTWASEERIVFIFFPFTFFFRH